MSNTFELLFQLKFQHNYFNKSSPVSVINLGPTILNGSPDIRLKKTENGYFAFRPSIPVNTNQASPSIESLSLCLPLYFTDPNFFNYSKINISPPSVLYFSSDQAINGVIQSNDIENITLCPSLFIYSNEIENQKKLINIDLIHPDGSTEILPLPDFKNSKGLQVDLRELIDGKYELHFNFKDEKEDIIYVFFSSDYFYNKPPPAIFECKFKIDKTEPNTIIPDYTISFESRSTYWQYVFPNFDKEDWNTVKIDPIEINNQTINFVKTVEKIQITKGQYANAIQSTQPISLMEAPPWKIKMSSARLPDGLFLPYPQISHFRIKPSESESIDSSENEIIQKKPKTYISDVFVHV